MSCKTFHNRKGEQDKMASIKFNRNFSIGRVVAKLVSVTLALYVGNTIMNVIGAVMNCTYGPFVAGFKLIGWTVTDGLVMYGNASDTTCLGLSAGTYNNIITSVAGTGVLAVIGLVGLASLVMEFVEFRMG